jgi:hypothetical protein
MIGVRVVARRRRVASFAGVPQRAMASGMPPNVTARIAIAPLFEQTLRGVQQQVLYLGETVTAQEFAAYVESTGPVADFVADNGQAVNPARSKQWHLGRVKFFYEKFRLGSAVEPIELSHHPLVGICVSDGSHRLLGAYLAGAREVDALLDARAVQFVVANRRAGL